MRVIGLVKFTYNYVLYSGAIIYVVFAAANWVAPSIVAILGLRSSLFLAAFVYTY